MSARSARDETFEELEKLTTLSGRERLEVMALAALEELRRLQEAHPGVGLSMPADVAAQAEMIVNATNGAGSISMLEAAGEQNPAGKVLLDIANPLDFSYPTPICLESRSSAPSRPPRRWSRR